MISRSEAQSRSDVIRDETGISQNTALRVGSLFRALSDSLVFIGDPPPPYPVVTETTTSRTLALGDAEAFVRCTNSALTTVTVPANSSVAFPIGTSIAIRQEGSGGVQIAAGGGVTLNGNGGSLTSSVPGATRFAVKVGVDEWDVFGDKDGERIPTQMIFTEVFRQAWFDQTVEDSPRLIPPALQWVDDPFTDTTTGRFTTVTEASAGSISISGGQFTLTNNSGATRMTLVYEGSPIGMPQLMTTVRVRNRTGTNGAYAAVLLGMVKDSNNYVIINWDTVSGTLTLQSKIGGVGHFDASTSLTASYPKTLGFNLCGNVVTMFAYASGNWTSLGFFDISGYVDMKSQDMSQWHAAFGFATPNTVTNAAVFENFQVGRFGGVGIRDQCVVTREDGSPVYFSPTVVKMLATIAPASSGISGSMGVFDVDLEQKTFTQVGLIMDVRGGKTQNDLAGHLVLEDNGDQHLTISSWGDGSSSVRIYYGFVASGTDLLTGSHAPAVTQLNLSVLPSGGSQWDPFLVRKDGTWYLAYTASPSAPNLFYPALDSSADLTTWSNVGSDPTAARNEGTRILPFAGQSYVLTGGQFNMRMYDLSMNYIGLVNCISPGDGTTQPHAMIFPYNALEVLVTFDQTPWPNPGGVAFSWGSIRWFASPRY